MLELADCLKNFDWHSIIQQHVSACILEDLGCLNPEQDVTGLLLPDKHQVTANLINREFAIISGIDWVSQTFKTIDPEVQIDWKVKDADQVQANTILAQFTGNARSILTAERIALNLLQTLSGTATQTFKLASLITDLPCQLLDTRKTLPGMRMAQKYAVFCGGGQNHRIGLFDRFLIKENHIKACGSIQDAISKARALQPELLVEIEVENFDELEQAIEAKADIIMLDNFTIEQTYKAVELNNKRTKRKIKLESSGNINSETLRGYAETGVDYISVGALTKSVEAIDLSLRVV